MSDSVPSVVALAELGVADLARGVDQVLGRPGLVLVRVPGLIAVVHGDGVVDTELSRRPE